MKKRILIALCLICALLFSGCSFGSGLFKEYKNSTPPAPQANQITVSPAHVYWDGDQLIAECYLVSGLSSTAYNIQLEELSFSDASGNLIAGNDFGALDGLTIAPYSHITCTFTFPKEAIAQPDVNLMALRWSSSISYSY